MKWGKPVLVVVTLLFVLFITFWEYGKLSSPGALHPSHKNLRELRGQFNCAACHGSDEVTMTDACLQCHVVITDQLNDGIGLHGGLNPDLVPSCNVCHAEHTDGELALVTDNSFKIAGVRDPEHYDHRHIEGFSLDGSHTELRCESCHLTAQKPALYPGDQRFLGLSQECAACHEDPHEGSFGLDCASCHGQSNPFEQVAAFEHTDDFALTGGHSGLSCKDCHDENTDFAIAALQENPPQSVRSCIDCHETPHDDQLLIAVAKDKQLTRRHETCLVCHDVSDESFLYPDAEMLDKYHAATGFTLDPPHHEQDCKQCHEGIGTRQPLTYETDLRERFTALFPNRSPDDCRACHEDPHMGQFDAGLAQGRCTECHQTTTFDPHTFDIEQHAETPFALTGAHEQTDCAQCHTLVNEVRQFAGTSSTCLDCHEDPHDEQFNDGPTAGRCDACHDTEKFQPTGFDQTKHGETQFPLLGAHQAVGCRDCHVEEDSVRRFVATPMECADCHEDVHEGIFDGPDKPALVGGQRGCARCHVADGFDQVKWTGDIHGQWTGYALVGAHEAATCTDCHTPIRQADGRNLTFAKVSSDCASCHEDTHAGQFRVEQTTDCAQCHTETQTFNESIFDHQAQSRFELDETHSKLDCGACHKGYPLPGGGEITRYKPLGIRCEDCHGFTSYQDRGNEQ